MKQVGPGEVSVEFIRRFCAADVEGLERLLTEDLKLVGPLFSFDSRDDYLASLIENPLTACELNLLSVTERDDTAAVFYEYIKSDRTIVIAQLSQIRGGRICQLRLVFDARGF